MGIVRLAFMSAASSKGRSLQILPIVQANKFELVINMQTARMLDIAVPTSLLAIADELME
jgi:hypothetical protein